jgi:hypothetical protein
MMAHGKERVNAVHVFGKGNADLIRSAPELAARVVELERQRKTICEALYNMIYLARPHFTDDVQRLAIAEASAALDFAAYTP